jgi:hypothetical protein
METQSISAMSQTQVREEATVQVQAMAINSAKEQAADLSRLMNSAEIITDPAKGNYLDRLM